MIASLFVHRSDLNRVIKVVKRIGVGSGNVRGLDKAKVFLGIFDLVVIVLLPVIRPQPILTLCKGAIGKYIWYVAP